MQDPSASDAQVLWEDACAVLAATADAQLAKMAAACQPQALEAGAVVVLSPSGFAARRLERDRALVEAALSDAAFEPMTFSIAGTALAGPSRAVVAAYPAGDASAAPAGAPMSPAAGASLSPAGASLSPGAASVSPAAGTSGAPIISAASATPIGPAASTNPGTPADSAPKTAGTSSSAPLVDGSATSLTREQFLAYQRQRQSMPVASQTTSAPAAPPVPAPAPNPLVQRIAAKDSTLTFDTFLEADENRFALQAAKQVANGVSDQYNPLFIHGSSGLGKTHLLRAIQNYVAANDPDRACAYRIASDFIGDYTNAIKDREHGMMEALERNYHDIDVLILDDVQHLKGATKTLEFFFNTFNYLVSHGKQIILAADEPPGQLGMDERITSRMSQGLSVAVQSPTLEFKRVLIETFYERMKAEGGVGSEGTLTPDDLALMADRAGGNIRSIRSFVQDCLFRASHLEAAGERLQPADIVAAAAERWANEGKRVSVEDIQHMVQNQYGITRQDLVGTKRSKEIAQPRHIAIWLCRELTDQTLAEIGKHFGGRSHATVKHSIAWVEETMEEDRVLFDRLLIMKERLGGS